MKRLISMLLLVIMVISLLPLSTLTVSAEVNGKLPAVSLEGDHSAVIKTDGSLWMWGNNKYGQLGNGTNKYSDTPIKIMDDVKLFVAKNNHSATIKNDNSLWMWGSNDFGQLGNGTTDGSNTPIKIMDNVKAVSLGSDYSAAIKNDGSLYMWGNNSRGRFGNGTSTDSFVPVKIMGNVESISLGNGYSAVIKTDGSLWMWGSNYMGRLGNGDSLDANTPVKIMDNVKSVSLDGNNGVAIKNDGSLWTWGDNDEGQLGNGTFSSAYSPVKIMDNVRIVSLVGECIAAIKNDGSLWTWGYNTDGWLGNGTTGRSNTPIKIMDDVKSVSLWGGYSFVSHCAAIKNDGSLWTWGAILGDGTSDKSYIPVKIMDNVKSVSLMHGYSAAIKNDDSLWMWGGSTYAMLGKNEDLFYIPKPIKIMQLNAGLVIEGENFVQNNKETILKATRYDANGNVAPEGGITWSCSDESVAQITPWGNNVTVKGLKGGKATITATHAESGQKADFEIEVVSYIMTLAGGYTVMLDEELEINYAVKQGEEYVHNDLDIKWEIETESSNDIIKIVSDKESAYTNILTIKGLNMGECDLVAKVDGSEIGRTKIYCEGSLAETIDNETILRAKVLVNNGAYNYDKSSKHIYETMIEGTNLTSAKIYDKISNIKKIVTGQYVDYNKIALLGMIECDESIKIYGDLGDLIKNDVAKHAVKKAYKKGLKEGTKLDENIDWSNVSEISKNTKKEYAAEVCKDLVGDKNKVLDIGILNSISMATSSTETFINAFSTAYAYSIVTDEKIAVLESIKNNTTNSDLKAAATEIIAEIKDAKANKIKSFAQKPTAAGIKTLFEETSDIVIDEIVDAIIDKGIKAGATSAVEKAAMAASIVKGVKIGYEVGTTVSDILFKADDLSGDLLTLAAICDIEYSMEKAMDSAENSFNKKQTIETADKLIAHAQLYKSLLIYGHQTTAGMVENVKQAKENQQSPLLDMFGLVGQSIKGWCLLLSGNDNTNYDVTITNIKNMEKEIISHDYFSLGDIDIAEYLREVKSTAISDWAKAEVNKAIKLGILPDYMQNNYQNNITRAEFCTILTNLITTKTGKTIDELIKEKGKQLVSPFKDTYYVYADYMYKLGIVSGVGNDNFDPLGEITREQAATMLMRTANVLGYDTSYNTSVETGVSSWATEGVGFVTENGIMNGTGNGFEPQGKYTKEQAIATFVRMYDNLK